MLMITSLFLLCFSMIFIVLRTASLKSVGSSTTSIFVWSPSFSRCSFIVSMALSVRSSLNSGTRKMMWSPCWREWRVSVPSVGSTFQPSVIIKTRIMISKIIKKFHYN